MCTNAVGLEHTDMKSLDRRGEVGQSSEPIAMDLQRCLGSALDGTQAPSQFVRPEKIRLHAKVRASGYLLIGLVAHFS